MFKIKIGRYNVRYTRKNNSRRLFATQNEFSIRVIDHLNKFDFINESQLGFNGELVKRQVYNEWWLSNVCRCDEPVFVTNQSIESNFPKFLSLADKLPLSCVSTNYENGKDTMKKSNLFYEPKLRIFLKKVTFCLPSVSTVLFHKQQRERKIWWRKFSAQPDRFKLTEISEDGGNQTVEINVEFPWGTNTIETIRCLSNPSIGTKPLLIKDGKKSLEPHAVVSECELNSATMTYLCDAYDPINEASAREIMRFHRKLAPFKIAFAVTASTAAVAKELTDLSLVLARKIRKVGTACLLLPDLAKKTLESQFLRNDGMGIPYTIVCNDKTLKDGIMAIRSRNTTLKEQSHVGIVVSYVEQLMRNY